ncbi:hypothetical protein FSC37_08920 [Piscinibacter aquaticus]|uniref:Uncharacterized protein n=1 Tax=Piscinibacter aquaticus TaxID=392597 RepID=A0A5C6U0E2_9BURK|nr:hypothetical protein FSC37_08920 [Piscinibacter aquaticus]
MPSAPARSPDPSERTLDALVSAAQYEMVVDRSRSSNLISVPFGAVVVWVLWGAVDHRLLIVWLGLKVAGSALRIGVTRAFDRHRPDGVQRWGGASSSPSPSTAPSSACSARCCCRCRTRH